MVSKGVIAMVENGFDTVMEKPEIVGVALVGTILSSLSNVGQSIGNDELVAFAFLFTIAGSVVSMAARAFVDVEHYNQNQGGSVGWVSRFSSRFLSLIGISIVTVIAVGLGFLALVIPGIYIALKLSIAPTVCVVENKGVVESLKTSWSYTEGNLLKILGIAAVSFMINISVGAAGILGMIIGMLFLPMAVVVGLLLIAVFAFVSMGIEGAFADFVLEAGTEEPSEEPATAS